MRILVIGGTGFIGSRVTGRLRAQGHEVVTLHRSATPPDIATDREQLDEAKAFAPEVVVHMIAMAEAHARAAVEAFAGIARRLVVVSSGDVYRARNRLFRVEPGEPDPVPLSEDAPLRSVLFPYGGDYEKILVERAAAADPRLPATVVRLGMVYGPGDPQNRLRQLAELSEGRCNWRPCRVYVENAAHGIALCATHPASAGRIYNLADGEVLSECDFAKRAGIDVRIVPETMPLEWSQDWILDTTRIRQELGYREVFSTGEAIRATLAG
jgi:nucleoside-diphosphate-sugar epimerase